MWIYDGVVIDEPDPSFIGFVYVITRLDTGRAYIGKKLLKFKRSKTIKGKKKKLLIDSDWKSYWGSNKTLQEEVKTLGEDLFKREIVRFCKTKGDCSYHEARLQFENRVLENPTLWYNEFIGCKIHRSHVKSY